MLGYNADFDFTAIYSFTATYLQCYSCYSNCNFLGMHIRPDTALVLGRCNSLPAYKVR